MTTHRSSRRRISGRARALVSLGAVAALATGLSVQGTFAFWTDSATLSTGSFTAGSLDLTVNGQLTGLGGTTTVTGTGLGAMVPGESQSASFPVANAGSVPLTWVASGTAAGTGAGVWSFQLFLGNAANTGTAAAGNRTGTCSGTALAASSQVLGATSAAMSATARTLAAGASETVCLVATLPGAADNTAQTKSVTPSIVFDAKQVGAP